MSNLAILRRQHTEVLEIINNIDSLIKNGDLDANVKDIAYSLSTLAGKLKMHLLSEDKFLYPKLMDNNNENIKNTAQTFYSEMGNVTDVFMSFIHQYNVPSKILQNRENFLIESKRVFFLAADRISKEDNKLYPLLDN